VGGRSNRGGSLGDSDSRPSTEFKGMSGLLLGFWIWVFWGESLRFFVDDVLTMSCLCSSGFALGSKVGGCSAEKVRWHS
jgi:hypothetical protein